MFGFAFLKVGRLRRSPPVVVPPLPVSLRRQLTATSGDLPTTTTDVVLFSKNRPLQTFAFLDSLTRHVTSDLMHVWLLIKTDDAVFDRGYELAERCFSSEHRGGGGGRWPFRLTIVRETDADGFRTSVLRALRSSVADYIVLAVDEFVWILRLDLHRACRPLVVCNDQDDEAVASFHIHLGRNLGGFATIDGKEHRFRRLDDNDDGVDDDDDAMYVFYPRRLKHDFGTS